MSVQLYGLRHHFCKRHGESKSKVKSQIAEVTALDHADPCRARQFYFFNLTSDF